MVEITEKEAKNNKEKESITQMKKDIKLKVVKIADKNQPNKKSSQVTPNFLRKTILKKTSKILSKHSLCQTRRQPPTYFDASSLSLTIKRLNESSK
ncbi:unnamed protein product [Oikopleura dioica]|uniref:Uncharacterized protein n=1 Tax=Oikopleura dioica TaxID=34765 RepID=E4WSX0_OIKDI|nr:unnamed protein product [Oikopleura dioica]